MTIPVRDLLNAPALGGARLIGGRDGLAREVSWTSVIEWQAVGFVRPGELVLTTGIGLDEPTLAEFLCQLLESEAAAVAISLPPSRPTVVAPEAAVALANQRGVPLIDLPWDVAFTDVTRWVVDELLRRRFAGSIDAPAEFHSRFSRVLRNGLGVAGIAVELEAALERPVLVFDAQFRLGGYGPLAERALGPEGLRGLRARAASVSPDDAGVLAARFDGERPRRFTGLDALGLGPGTGQAAFARHAMLGFVYVLDRDGYEKRLPSLALRALDAAVAAVAIEGLHSRSAADDRLREDFLWQLMAGLAGAPEEVGERAARLGFNTRVPYELAVARADVAGAPELTHVARELRARAARAARRLTIGLRDRDLVAIAAAPDERRDSLHRLVVEVQAAAQPAQVVSWGVAAQARPLAELPTSYREARRALEVGEAVVGPGTVGEAGELAPYMMLARLGGDPEALEIARTVVEPLLAYDRAKGRNLVETLDVYLQESGNTSAAARRLVLNRRSLAYRLHRIEELTGRSLDRPADRFVLDLSIKLLRFGIVKGSSRD